MPYTSPTYTVEVAGQRAQGLSAVEVLMFANSIKYAGKPPVANAFMVANPTLRTALARAFKGISK